MRAKIDARVLRASTRRGVGALIDLQQFAYTFPLEVLGDLRDPPRRPRDVHSWASRIAENSQRGLRAGRDRCGRGLRGPLAYIDRLIERQRASAAGTGLVTP